MNSEYDLCNNNGKVIGLRLISMTKNISYKLYGYIEYRWCKKKRKYRFQSNWHLPNRSLC